MNVRPPMRYVVAWVVAVVIAACSTSAQATCQKIGRRKAVCSSPDGEGYVVGIDGAPARSSSAPREIGAARPVGSSHLEGGLGPTMWSSWRGPTISRPALGGEAFIRGLYAWRPRARGLEGIGGALATTFVGDHVGVQVATAVLADGTRVTSRARIGTSHRITMRRFWVPAIFSLLPSVGIVHERRHPAQLDLTSELPFGLVAAKHVGVELRPGVFYRRGPGVQPHAGITLSLALVLF